MTEEINKAQSAFFLAKTPNEEMHHIPSMIVINSKQSFAQEKWQKKIQNFNKR